MSNTNDLRKTNTERRKKMRRLGKERRDQVRWDKDNPIRRKSPGRRALDHLMYVLNFNKK